MARKVPLYKKLYADLKRSIDDGKYPVGSLLPSENELCEKYETTRATVRHSLKELMILGYITRRHGKGSIVAEPKKGLGILSIRGVTAAVGTTTLKTKIVKTIKRMKWPADFFYDLSEKEMELGCLFFTRIRYVNNVPVLYEETYLTDHSLSGFALLDLENKSLFGILKNIELK
jgi:DNA-binding GntR family transcriptional regulator